MVLQTLGWSLWAIGAIGIFAVLPAGLTAIRLITPMMFVASVAALPHALSHDLSLLLTFFAIFITALCEIALLLPSINNSMVQGGAYGNENRLALRTPVPYLVPAVVTWALTAASTIGAPLLLASKQWIIGGGVAVIALGLLSVVPQRMHRLSRRWLVIVPSGIVIHDHLVLAETMMLTTSNIADVVLSDTPATEADLTGGVFGSRLIITLRESEKVVISAMTMKLLKSSQGLHVQSFAIAPSSPTHSLQQIQNRISRSTNE